MFGYVTINQNELKVKDYNRYRSFYCGLCYCLKKKYGFVGQSILSYDLTFLDILINSLYEESLINIKRPCLVHPGRRHDMVFNSITSYIADMSVLLAYYNALDDINDNKKLKNRAVPKALAKAFAKVEKAYPAQCEKVKECIDELNRCERLKIYDLDRVSGLTGKMLSAVFVYKDDEWSDEMERMGFYLGKFIYLMDAYEDLKEDVKSGRYNVWMPLKNRPDFDAYVENTLILMMGDCAREFEKLPLVQDTDILRNIIYSGVWSKYAAMKRNQQQEVEDDS